jgi:hypothetical protein
MTTPTANFTAAAETLTSEEIDRLLAADEDFLAECDRRHDAYMASVEADDEGAALAGLFDVSDSLRFLPR